MLVGGVLLGRGATVRALLATCAPSPCASKVRRKPEAFPLWGLGPPRTEYEYTNNTIYSSTAPPCRATSRKRAAYESCTASAGQPTNDKLRVYFYRLIRSMKLIVLLLWRLFAVRQCAARASTLITHKHFQKEENHGKLKPKGNLCTESNSLLCLLSA